MKEKTYLIKFEFKCVIYDNIVNDFSQTIGGEYIDMTNVNIYVNDGKDGMFGNADVVTNQIIKEDIIKYVIENLSSKIESICGKRPEGMRIVLLILDKNHRCYKELFRY